MLRTDETEHDHLPLEREVDLLATSRVLMFGVFFAFAIHGDVETTCQAFRHGPISGDSSSLSAIVIPRIEA
jgi:hypothetical protein